MRERRCPFVHPLPPTAHPSTSLRPPPQNNKWTGELISRLSPSSPPQFVDLPFLYRHLNASDGTTSAAASSASDVDDATAADDDTADAKGGGGGKGKGKGGGGKDKGRRGHKR